tara:strand:+ start:154 stop:432 length:279 start_codon:yes stop_codon:yes gene_type:complete
MSKKMERRSQQVSEKVKGEVDSAINTAKESGQYYIHISYKDDNNLIQHFNAQVEFPVGDLVPTGNNIDDFLREKIPSLYCSKLRTSQRNSNS